MASFASQVYRVKIEPHNNADSLELAVIGAYRSIVRKGQYKDGDLVAYIPEQAIVPTDILQEIGLEGRLNGPNKNRVKAMKLRGVISQGLVYPARQHWIEGMDVTEELRVTKYEPPIPAQFAGELASSPVSLHYDIENFKKWPDTLREGEDVIMTEKIHGTFFCIGMSTQLFTADTQAQHMFDRNLIVSSKGLIKKGIYIRDNDANVGNVYIRAARKFDLGTKLVDIVMYLAEHDLIDGGSADDAWLMGEVYGKSVQRNSGIEGYDIPQGELAFRAFDIKIGDSYLDYGVFKDACDHVGLETVPLIYEGPFSVKKLEEMTSGAETVSGKGLHIREGVVVKPIIERVDLNVGRVILKSVSDEYLMKSDGEELS